MTNIFYEANVQALEVPSVGLVLQDYIDAGFNLMAETNGASIYTKGNAILFVTDDLIVEFNNDN